MTWLLVTTSKAPSRNGSWPFRSAATTRTPRVRASAPASTEPSAPNTRTWPGT